MDIQHLKIPTLGNMTKASFFFFIGAVVAMCVTQIVTPMLALWTVHDMTYYITYLIVWLVIFWVCMIIPYALLFKPKKTQQ